MASEAGTSKNVRKKPRTLNYFYLDGELDGKMKPLLHKKLHINRGADTITAWCYPLYKRVTYTYSDVLRLKGPAFTTQETAKMLMRGRQTIERAIIAGDIAAPQMTYGLDENRNPFKYMWSERDILDAHAFLSTVSVGRPRKDGLPTPKRLPTVRELRAMMRDEEILYVKQGDSFLPTWRAENF